MSAFTGTAVLVRAALRRDRVLIGAWLAVFALMGVTSARGTVDLYPTLSSRTDAAAAINDSKALVALYGRIYDPTSIGALSMIKMGSLGAVFVAMLAVVIVIRHTRGDEEAGRTELLGGTAMGRRAPLGAAMVVVVAVNVVLALVTAVALTASGLPSDGSLAFGAAWAGVGIAFGAIAAVAAQLTTSARTATAISAATLAVVYALRAVGDAGDETGARWLRWLSPIGWGQQFRPFAGNRWWVLLLTLGFAVATTAAAFALAARRDLGSGLLPSRPGPPHASPRLASPLALAWRIQRVALTGWGAMFLLVGALLGGLAASVEQFFTNPEARDLFVKLGGEKAMTDVFLAVEFGMAGVIAAAYGVQAVLHLHSEEAAGRGDAVLATAVSRIRWAGSHMVVATTGTAGLLALAGLGAGVVRAGQLGEAAEVPRLVAAALVQLPAALVVVAITLAAFGLAPRLVAAGWVALGAFVLLAEIGPLLGLSQWIMDISPFTHPPKLPGGPFSARPLVLLVLAATAIAAAGLAGLRRRDIG